MSDRGGATGGEGDPVRVFAVDDHPVFLATAELVVGATAGFQMVGIATSGREALVALHPDRPEADLLLVDVVMPGQSGLEFVRAYRATGGRAAVVFLSSYGPDDLPADVVDPGDTGAVYLAKDDLSPDSLLATWARLVDRPTIDHPAP